jgi:hypothetical protein
VSGDAKGVTNNKLKTNLRDIDTILLFLESFSNLHESELFKGILTFLEQMLNSQNHQIWKKAIYMAEIIVQNVHSSFCPEVLKIVDNFYSKNIESKAAMKNGKKSKKSKGMEQEDEAIPDVGQGMIDEEKEQTERLGDTQRKVKDLVIRFLAEFVKNYYVEGLKQKSLNLQQVGGSGEMSITKFASAYLPLAIISLKSRSSKTRDNAKKLLISIDESYEAITGQPTLLLNMVRFGLSFRLWLDWLEKLL